MSTTNMLTMIKEWTDSICWSAHIRSQIRQSKSKNQNQIQIQRRSQNRSRRRRRRSVSLLCSALLLFVSLAFFVSQVRGSTSNSTDASSLTKDSYPAAIQSSGNNGSRPIHLLMIENSSSTLSHHQSASSGQRSSRSRRHCPSCQLAMAGQDEPAQQRRPDQQQTVGDTARLESIKRQILVKLGLNSKPNLLSTIPPRDFILETLLRAEESTVAAASVARPSSQQGSSKDHHQHHHHHHSASADNSQENNGVEDDFYGKTSEIIAFGEPGPRLNGQVLAEFSRVQETAPEPSLRVKAATLWIYVQLKSNDGWTSGQPKSRHHRHFQQPDRSHQSGTNQPNSRRQPTLYVFRLLSHPPFSTNFSLDKNWNELLASQRVTIQHSGWMKINITEGVRKWFSTSSPSSTTLSSSKLQLLVDCSGCGSSVEPVLFSSSSASQKSKKKKKKRRRRRRRRRLVEEGEEQGEEGEEEEEEKRKQHRPFIVIHTDSSSSRRLRRRTPLDCSPTTSACCKQRFFVSFRALGWDDWIIAPSGYYANYCRGDCGGGPSGNSRTPDTFLSYHSHVIDEVRKLPSFHQAPASGSSSSSSSLLGTSSLSTTSTNLDEEYNRHQLIKQQQQQQQQLYASLQPCCAPTKFSSMSLIYFGPDMNIIKRDLPKMVVDECGCP